MVERFDELEKWVSLPSLLGYVNYSTGRPDVRFQKGFNDAHGWLEKHGETTPWLRLPAILRQVLHRLHQEGVAAYQDIQQADHILQWLPDYLLPAYRSHHQDLLGHRLDAELFQPFFLVRAIEALLSQGAPAGAPPTLGSRKAAT